MACADYIINVEDQDNLDFTVGKAVISLVKKFNGDVKHEYKKAHKYYVSVPEKFGDDFKDAADNMMFKKGFKATVVPDKTAHTLPL
ncbi:hypothetical protein MOUN0_I08834 [Monosporozyma unispora]